MFSRMYRDSADSRPFNVVASYLGDDAGRFVAEVESIEL